MKQGLKVILYERIKKAPLYLSEIYEICDTEGYKHDNATRRLRELVDSGLVDRIMGKNAIIGYQINSSIQKIEAPKLSISDMAIEQMNNLSQATLL